MDESTCRRQHSAFSSRAAERWRLRADQDLHANVVSVVIARTGKELWSEKIDAPAHAIPSTYMGRDGKQYVAIAAGGGGFLQSPTSDTVIAFSLQ